MGLVSLVLLALASTSVASPTNVTKRLGPGKRGLVWPWFNSPLDPARLNDFQGTINLIYDYETYAPPSSNGNGGLNFIGMQRCLDCQSSPLSQLAARQQQLGFATLFTLNEPDINNISPGQAADWYVNNINPFRIHKALPAVTSSTSAGQGLDWLQQMVNACAGRCFYDYINLHWYGQNFGQFQSHITQAHNQFPNTRIVVTEFALANPPGGQADQCVLSFLRLFTDAGLTGTHFRIAGSRSSSRRSISWTMRHMSRCTSRTSRRRRRSCSRTTLAR
ncbi:unnamed protein product [Mycena citricolor]|uniref:Asl1-like glycosyl hydrolase catalytic domain-containing protein n=1 Tax=Mycena citricolor TaxID=2018698 RepID=A0AAD2GWR5_9AGAR|nr:unnamed protein product [Mycena citricolor]